MSNSRNGFSPDGGVKVPQLSDLPPIQSTSTYVHPTQVDDYGTHCAHPYCGMGELLPFKCTYCAKSHCSAHRTPHAHACEKYDFGQDDVRAATCPLCNEVLPISDLLRTNAKSADIDINAAMQLHIDGGKCSSFAEANGGVKPSKRSPNQCPYPPCKTRMAVPMLCERCKLSHCPSHREPKKHNCKMLSDNSRSSTPLPSVAANPAPIAKKGPQLFSAFKNATSTNSDSTKASSSATSPASLTSPFAKLTVSASSATSDTKQSSAASGQSKLKTSIAEIKNDRAVSKRAAKERASADASLKKRAEKGWVESQLDVLR